MTAQGINKLEIGCARELSMPRIVDSLKYAMRLLATKGPVQAEKNFDFYGRSTDFFGGSFNFFGSFIEIESSEGTSRVIVGTTRGTTKRYI